MEGLYVEPSALLNNLYCMRTNVCASVSVFACVCVLRVWRAVCRRAAGPSVGGCGLIGSR